MIRGDAIDWMALFGAAALTMLLILLLRPLLRRYALARPNARSSHREPTPQGGGIAVIGAITITIAAVAFVVPNFLHEPLRLAVIFTCTIGLAAVGVTDDIRPLQALPRLLSQAVVVAVMIAALPVELRILPQLSWWLERAFMLIGGVWFVNLVNFMDGIDWMTVAEVVPLTACLALFGLTGVLSNDGTVVAFALCGTMLGFAPFNRPVARLFLGDVGSLPIGLLLAWLLVLLAERYLTAALLLPLYYLADATITLLRRFAKGERVTQAHRSHFYQRATDNGFSVIEIVGLVFVVNVLLAILATATVLMPSRVLHIAALAVGCALVSLLLYRFTQAKLR